MKKIKILAIICALAMTTNVHAALQSRPGVDAKLQTNASEFFKYIREMESEGGVLGLNATFAENATTQEYEETSFSNNIDVHMCKNTEWGAIAMLSASSYGAGNGNVKDNYTKVTKTYDITASTTGNRTGIFGMNSGAGPYEYMAAGIIAKMSSSFNYLKKAAIRYVDNYEDGTDSSDFSRYIPGDATYETMSFSGGGGYFVYSSYPWVMRGSSGVFYSYWLGLFGGNGGSRACVWVGDGI